MHHVSFLSAPSTHQWKIGPWKWNKGSSRWTHPPQKLFFVPSPEEVQCAVYHFLPVLLVSTIIPTETGICKKLWPKMSLQLPLIFSCIWHLKYLPPLDSSLVNWPIQTNELFKDKEIVLETVPFVGILNVGVFDCIYVTMCKFCTDIAVKIVVRECTFVCTCFLFDVHCTHAEALCFDWQVNYAMYTRFKSALKLYNTCSHIFSNNAHKKHRYVF